MWLNPAKGDSKIMIDNDWKEGGLVVVKYDQSKHRGKSVSVEGSGKEAITRI